MNLQIKSKLVGKDDAFDKHFLSLGSMPTGFWTHLSKLHEYSLAQMWVVLDGESCLARISANKLVSHDGCGAVGWLSISSKAEGLRDELVSQLLATASRWLASVGVQYAYGPMNTYTWLSYRLPLGVEEWEEKPFTWEPRVKPGELHLWQDAGFEPADIYQSQGRSDLKQLVEHTKSAYEKLAGEAIYHFETLPLYELTASHVSDIYRLSSDGFSGNHLFEPIPIEVFASVQGSGELKSDHTGRVCFLRDKSAKALGFYYIFYDRGYAVLKTAAVLSSQRGKGVANALCHVLVKKAHEDGYDKFITALVHQGNVSEAYNKRGDHLWTHRYTLMRKQLVY